MPLINVFPPIIQAESNSEVFCLKRKKNHLWKKYLLTCSSANLSNFKSINNQIRNLASNLRKDFEKSLMQGVKSILKAFWRYIIIRE